MNPITVALGDAPVPSPIDALHRLDRNELPVLVRQLLQDLSADTTTFFGRHGLTQEELLERLRSSLVASKQGDATPWLLIVLAFGSAIEMSERLSREGVAPSEIDLNRIRSYLSSEQSVSSCLKELYDLPNDVSDSRIDWDSLTLHRLGTTSIIFTVTTSDVHAHRLVVKLSHIMFMSVGPVASATSAYCDDWGRVSRRCEALTSVWASGPGWVIEDFVPGETVAEACMRMRSMDVDSLDIVSAVFFPILDAIDALHQATDGRGHGDLTPSNIMVRNLRAEGVKVTFIDMGRNLLASEVVGRVTAAERFYVAPEVRELSPEVRVTDLRADLYSLGPLLAFCLGYGAGEGLFGLDDRIFAEHPEFARVASACSLDRAELRGSWLFGESSGTDAHAHSTLDVVAALRQRVFMLVRMLRDIQPAVLAAPGGVRLYSESLLGSWGKVVAAAKRIVRLRLASSGTGVASIGSWRIFVSALAFSIGAFLLAYSICLDYGRDPLTLQDLWNKTQFDDASVAEHWQIRAVGASFLVACFQYNICAFGWVYYTRCTRSRAIKFFGEGLLWLLTTIVDICIVVCFFLWPKGWLLCSALGVLAVAVNNLLGMRIRKLVAEETGLEVLRVELNDRDREDILSYWTPTALAYSSVLLIVAILSVSGVIHDWGVWALAMTTVNVVVLSYSQATRQGFKVRREMSRTVVAGELGK